MWLASSVESGAEVMYTYGIHPLGILVKFAYSKICGYRRETSTPGKLVSLHSLSGGVVLRYSYSFFGIIFFTLLALTLPQRAMPSSDKGVSGDTSPGDHSPDEEGRRYEVLALDEGTGRGVLMDVAGATVVLRQDEETPDGLRLRSVAHGLGLIDVRYKSSGEVIAYRIALGETVHIRPLPEHRSGGTRAVAIPLQDIPPGIRTGAKENPQKSAQD
jgi:hypothetical protein